MGGEIRVVYVDDDREFADLVADALVQETARIAVTAVGSVDSAFELLSAGGIDCVVSAHDLPGTDGLEFLESVRGDHPDLPFILFPKHGSETLASRAIARGVTSYVPATDESEQYDRLAAQITEAVEATGASEVVETLMDVTASMQTAHEQEALAQMAIEAVDDALDAPVAVCWLYNPDTEQLEPAVATDSARERGLDSALAAGDDGYERFLEGTVTTTNDTERQNGERQESEAEDGAVERMVWLPLGDHGLIAFGGEDPRLNGRDLELGRLLAEHTTRALNRVEQHRERRNREQRLRVIAEHIDEAVYLVTPDFSEVQYVNPAYEDIWGRSVEELYEEPLSFLEGIDPRDRGEVKAGNEMIMSDLERGEYGRNYWTEFRVRQPNGEIRWVYSSGQTVELPNGEIRFAASARDITERKRQEQRLEVFNRVLRHNLRNQLDVIRSHAEVLADNDDSGHARTILATVDGLSAMGEQARTIDRFMSREIRRKQVDVAEILQQTIETVDRPGSDVDLTVDVSSESDLVSDRDALHSILESVLENAVMYADSTVDVSVEEVPYGFEITIDDDGPGIPEAELASLNAGTETDLQHGRGLGLWQLKWGVEKLKGELSFDTNEGTTVQITIPHLDGREGGR